MFLRFSNPIMALAGFAALVPAVRCGELEHGTVAQAESNSYEYTIVAASKNQTYRGYYLSQGVIKVDGDSSRMRITLDTVRKTYIPSEVMFETRTGGIELRKVNDVWRIEPLTNFKRSDDIIRIVNGANLFMPALTHESTDESGMVAWKWDLNTCNGERVRTRPLRVTSHTDRKGVFVAVEERGVREQTTVWEQTDSGCRRSCFIIGDEDSTTSVLEEFLEDKLDPASYVASLPEGSPTLYIAKCLLRPTK